MTRLSTLDLSNNQINVVPNNLLRQTPNIEQLLLDNNLIETVVLEVSSFFCVSVS